MDDISQTAFQNRFSWIRMHKFRLKFNLSLFLGSNQQYSITGSDNGLELTRWQAIIWSNGGKFTEAYMRHSASMSELSSYLQLIKLEQLECQCSEDIMHCTHDYPYCCLISNPTSQNKTKSNSEIQRICQNFKSGGPHIGPMEFATWVVNIVVKFWVKDDRDIMFMPVSTHIAKYQSNCHFVTDEKKHNTIHTGHNIAYCKIQEMSPLSFSIWNYHQWLGTVIDRFKKNHAMWTAVFVPTNHKLIRVSVLTYDTN